MIFVVHGAATIDGKTLATARPGAARARSRLRRARTASRCGATSSRPRQPAGSTGNGTGVRSREKLSAVLETIPQGELLLRGDSVAFPPGGCAFLHRHWGPGIRCLIDGGIRIDTLGHSTSYGPGSAVVRDRLRSGVRAGRDGPAEPLHPRDDPAARADRQKLVPVRQRGGQGEAAVQQYKIFADMPIATPAG